MDELHTPKQEKMSILACVRNHLICELRSISERILYMHDSAPAHFRRAAQDVPNNAYKDRGPTARPPRTPDLNHLGIFFLSEPLTTLVHAVAVDNEKPLHHRVVDAYQTILNCPSIFERMRWSMMRRVEVCIESRGEHFEHLLHIRKMYSFSYNSQIKCFCTHVDTDNFSRFCTWNLFPIFVHTLQLQPAHTQS
jgi:hypothetical protein